MSAARSLLVRSIVKPYYRQNAGLLGFLVFIMVFAVGRANQAGLLEYHFSLIQALLTRPAFGAVAGVAWGLYALKNIHFVRRTLQKEEYSFLNIVTRLKPIRLYGWLLLVQAWLFLPVIAYALIATGVGWKQHWYAGVALVAGYVTVICIACAGWYLFLLRRPLLLQRDIIRGSLPQFLFSPLPFRRSLSRPKSGPFRPHRYYWKFFVDHVAADRKILFLVIKVYDCVFLYGMVVNQLPVEYDLRMVFLFYSFGVLGHGVLIHRIRELEETRLLFYRTLPLSLSRRFVQYAVFYGILFLPEILTIAWLTPAYLHYGDAFLFVFLGYSLLLLLNSILFVVHLKMPDYLKRVIGIYGMIFIAVLTGTLPGMAALAFILSVVFFFRMYGRYER